MKRSTKGKQATFAVGDRVLFNANPSDWLDGHWVAGEIVDIVHGRALIRPDEPVDGTVTLAVERLIDIRKEKTRDGNS